MSRATLFLFVFGQLAIAGGVFLLYPLIVRRGLLFGVYVGEERSAGEAARAITRTWYRGMGATLAVAAALGALLAALSAEALAAVAPIGVLLAGFVALYLRAYRQARALAPAEHRPAAVAPLAPAPSPSPVLPAIAVAVALACGAWAIAEAWQSYGAMPERVPTHFGFSGAPDAWQAKSFATVMLVPLLTLVIGFGLAVMAWLVGHAKRALRAADHGVSLAAQLRFRTAMTRFLAGVALLTTALLTALSHGIVRVSTGAAPTLGWWHALAGGALLVWALGGTVLLALRYGQGGARLERGAAAAPLTNGLADNSRWVLGVFYVNRDDPSILVERRFGFGYTINFGNPKAVALFAVFMAAVLGMVIAGLVTS